MKPPAQLAVWGALTVISVAGFGFVIYRQRHEIQSRVAVQVASRPISGKEVFASKGCAICHGNSAGGTEFGPSLQNRTSLTSLSRLVTTMWNHAPQMWRAMEQRQLPYPKLSYEEMSQLVTYLYFAGYTDHTGNLQRGQFLFEKRKCAGCHKSNSSGGSGPSLQSISDAEDPLSWTQVLWNHASKMDAKMQDAHFSWPRFESSDMNDLFYYVRHARNLPDDSVPAVRGDPDRGWALFQEKGCILCQSVSSEHDGLGPSFGAEHQLPPTLSEFGAALLNHFSAMEVAMQSQKVVQPQFGNQDVADIAVFLYTLHYLEPSGSPQIGRSVFAWRGCNQCHGDNAEGTASGPALRGRGHPYTTARLATALWAHGARMYESAQKQARPWPSLEESDIGHLLTYLNTAPDR